MADIKNDLGTENIPKLVVRLGIPTIIAQLVNLLYNIVDRIYIGHIPDIGSSALTGVGLFAPILMLITAFASLIGSGGAPRAAIAMGQKDDKAAEKIIGNSMMMLLIFSLVLTVFLYIFAPWLLVLFGASQSTLPYGVSYARIYILGTVCVMTVLGMNPFITAQGFTRISMLTIVIGAVLNIILDPIFIFVLNLGVQGAAIATIISQAVGAVWILRFLTGPGTLLKLRLSDMPLQGKVILPCMALGVSAFVMTGTESLLSICFNASLAHYGGDVAVGAMTILTSISQLGFLPVQGLCQGVQPISSYNFGAGNKARVKQAFWIIEAAGLTYITIFWILCMLFPGMLVGIFTNDPQLVSYSSWALRVYIAGYFAIGSQAACQQTFVALGQAKISLLMACLRKLILLIPLILLLPHILSNQTLAVFLAEPISDITAATVTTTLFLTRFNGILDRGAQKI